MRHNREERRREHAAQGSHEQVLVEADIDDQRDVRADGQVVAMREVGNALDAENQRCTDASERQDRAGDQAVHGELDELLE